MNVNIRIALWCIAVDENHPMGFKYKNVKKENRNKQ